MATFSLPPPQKSSDMISLSSTTKITAVHAHDAGDSAKQNTTLAVTTIGGGDDGDDSKMLTNSSNKKDNKAPTYTQRCEAAAELSRIPRAERKGRKIFVPRSLEDFDDGGAFPEIHVAQYPRHMGNPHMRKKAQHGASLSASTSRAIVNVEVDKDGEISYDAIVKGGTNADKTVYSRYEHLRGGEAKAEDIALPSAHEEAETANRTQLALEKMLSAKTALNKPSGSAIMNANTSKDIEEKTQFIKYTPRPDAPGYNPAAAQRVIQMVPAQVDPMMPPKHQHKKAPRGPAEDPVPVLHAPPTKLTKEERDQWNIPACISNWKNTRGYTIPLDKRLAADGRGLREHTINSNFATLSESLYVAERQARQEVRLRAQVQKKLTMQEKDRREEELRKLANQARLEQSAAMGRGAAACNSSARNADYNERVGRKPQQSSVSDDDESQNDARSNEFDDDEDDDDVAARQRERLRKERRKERERELRQENISNSKKQKLEQERDVSEKIALGVHTGTGGTGEVDSRLYNQSAGMDSGFGAEDEYNTYSKPLFGSQGVSSASIYRPSRGETAYDGDEAYDKLVKGSTSKFEPSKGFAGAEGGGNTHAGPRTAPVQFEKEKN